MSQEDAVPSDHTLSRRQAILGLLALVAGGGAREAAAGPVTRDQFGDQIQTLPRRELPDFAKSEGPHVREVYRFALEHGADLEYIPCFCGCANIGHRHNRECYIKSENRGGTVTWTSHGGA